jgi:hypothetical protein
MHTYALLAAVQAASSSDDGLTLVEVLSNIPRDPAAIFTYVLLVVTFGGILWVGRRRKPRRSGLAS